MSPILYGDAIEGTHTHVVRQRTTEMSVTSPAVTELSRPLEPVSRDTFLDDLASDDDPLRLRDEEASSAPNGR
jgi:hypothetical protein